ncbi:MAG: glycosyltransferase family 39 protein [Candidatus Omnitrophota bacterium]
MKKPLFWIFVLGFSLRAAVVLSGVGFDRDLAFFDARDYDQHALHFLRGEGLTNGHTWASRLPLYPIFLAAVYRMFGHSYLAVRLIQSLLGALAILLAYGIFRKSFSRKVSLWASFLGAIHPLLIRYAGNILSETLSLFLLSVFLWVFLYQKGWRRFWGGGALFGVLLLCRASMVFFLPLVLLHLCREGKGKPVRALVGFILSVMLVMSPWVIRNYRLLHEFVPLTTNGGTTFWDANNPESLRDTAKTGIASQWVMPGKVVKQEENGEILLSEVEGDRYLYKKGLLFWRELLRERPLSLGYLFLRKFLAAFSLHGGEGLAALLGSIALYLVFLPWGLLRSRYLEKAPTLLYSVILQYVVCSLVFFGRAKYRVVIEPYLIAFILLGALEFIGVLGRISRNNPRTKALRRASLAQGEW